MGQVSRSRVFIRVSLFGLFVSVAVYSQQLRVLAPHKPVPPRLPNAKVWHKAARLRTLTGALWMTDANLKSTIHITNNLVTNSLTVTPLLFLSNGQRFTLPDVTLPPSGTAVLSVNDALQQQGVAPWATLFGYVEIQYQWPWDAICATVRNTDSVHSTVFAYNLRVPSPGDSQSKHVVEGMWWKQESNVTGFVALSNPQSQTVNGTVEVSDNAANVVAKHSVSVSANGSKWVDLPELAGIAVSEGAVRVTYDGPDKGLMINAGLQDQATGYSANIPFAPAPPDSTKASQLRYAEVGIMVGAADPMMRFPDGTTFTPYSVLRNISDQTIAIAPNLYWMEGANARTAQLQKITLEPSKALSLDVMSLIAGAGLKNFNGNVSLVLDVAGRQGGLLMASGSVDQKNTYVFEVMPQAAIESSAKSLSYWSTANADDTMVTLWNPADEAQDLVFTLFFSGGHYGLPVHLGPRATQTFTLSELIQNQIPDPEGNLIPPSVHDGSAEISGPKRGE